MNTLDKRKGIKRKKARSPTFDGFEGDQPSKRTTVSPSDQGWDRCKSGFNEEIIHEELISNSPWKVKTRKTSKNKPSSKSAKFAPPTVSDLQLEGSEEEVGSEEEPGDVDIDWSSSEESNLSDVEPLVCDVSPDPKLENARQKQSKDKFTSKGATTSTAKKTFRAEQWLSKKQDVVIEDVGDEEEGGGNNKQAFGAKYQQGQVVSQASTIKKTFRAEQWLSKKEDVVIEDVGDEGEGGNNKKAFGAKYQQGQVVSQASTCKTNASIDDYDSPSEEPQDTSATPSIASEPSQQNCDSAQISELSPSPTEDVLAKDTAGSSTQVTGSQWMKRLILPVESPEKEEGKGMTTSVCATGDSAKKKKKFVKSGLAERLQKLMNREKSSIAFWNHQVADAKKQPQETNSSTLTVEVQSMEHLQGLYITRCNQLNAKQQVSTDEQAQSGGNQQVFVLFSHNTGENLKIAVGLQIRIHPPWQKLTLPNYSEPVILSTYFCQSLGHGGTDGDITGDEDDTLEDSATPLTAYNLLKKPFQPLKLFEGISSKTSTHVTASGSLLESITSSDAKMVVSDSILDCVAESGAYSTSGVCIRARVQRVYCKRINSPSNQGIRPLGLGRQQTSPSSSHNVQWIMLLQDSHGVFCELQLPIDSADRPRWKEHIQHGEGRVLVFSGVKVVHRTNRSRSPGLFSLIDSVSSPSDMPPSQDFSSQSESELEDQNLKASKKMRGQQNFCYTLGFQLGQGAVEENLKQEKKQTSFKPSQICNLETLLQETNPSQRVSFYASILHTSPETNTELPGNPPSDSTPTQRTGWHVLVSDPSLQMSKVKKMDTERDECGFSDARRDEEGANGRDYVYLHVRSGCVLSGLDMADVGKFGSQVFCKDVCVQPGASLSVDMYSAILKLDNNCQRCDRINGCHQPEDGNIMTNLSRVTMPTVPKLMDTTTEHSIVLVNGKIRGVDESTAYSWPVCATCGNEKLLGDESGSLLQCSECNVTVTNPVIKMHLEVFLDCDASCNNNTVVKIKLLQSTIETVLPPLAEQEEGYDIQCILGKTLEPIRCFLSNITILPSGERCMELEEICVPSS